MGSQGPRRSGCRRQAWASSMHDGPLSDGSEACDWTLIDRSKGFSPCGCRSRARSGEAVQLAVIILPTLRGCAVWGIDNIKRRVGHAALGLWQTVGPDSVPDAFPMRHAELSARWL